jgi:hypothetical protein
MTYDELGDLMDCDAAIARTRIATMALDRRKSRDGQTRVKLNGRLTDVFLDRAARHRIDGEIATCAADLLAMRDRMAEQTREAELLSVDSIVNNDKRPASA